MNQNTAAQQASIKWGGVEGFSFATGGTSYTLSQTLSQLCKLECDRPRVWLIVVTVDVTGFDAETNPLTVQLQATPAAGRGSAQILTPIVIAPPYAQYQDQGFLPGTVQLAAKLSGGPFTSAALHNINVTVAAAPWSGDNDEVRDELRALRAEMRAFMVRLAGGR